MSKKIIYGLIITLVTGTMGFASIGEAVDDTRSNRTDTYKTERRNQKQREWSDKEMDNYLEEKVKKGELTREQVQEMQKQREESSDMYRNEDREQYGMHRNKNNRNHHSRMRYSCWDN
ncbi:hypothetical protein [Candidatus Enterococcus mansonii]|uniref:Uncharacterized protein n=1 Tax=Candidatus Enterococcus mansonii TaxID=1834181 RepID=A0A242CHQ3_9ENTE|nr:hypothetical protein [Enterococcus sp. 4G2_DIV0659]OTO09773.1 hypothetical protein A5880_000454 [Enterococcus sp. 4G2_DIV0659]